MIRSVLDPQKQVLSKHLFCLWALLCVYVWVWRYEQIWMGEGSSPNRKIAFCLFCVHHHSLVISAVSAKAAPRSLRSKFCKYSSRCPWISTNILIIGETSPERNIYNSQLPTVAHSTKMQNSLGLNINLLSQSWKWWMGMSYLVNSKSCLKSCMILS